jgi:Fic family protein
VRALSDADRAAGSLAGEGRRLPDPHLLIRPFVRREAVLSSRIEGTQATLGELLLVEAGSVVERSPDDLREVANYVVAMEQTRVGYDSPIARSSRPTGAGGRRRCPVSPPRPRGASGPGCRSGRRRRRACS